MKFFSKTFLFCIFICVQCVFLDSISAAKFRRNGNDSGTLGGNVRDIRSSDAMLLSDEIQGKEVGEDVILSGYGPINLTLTHEILEFEVCKSCMGTSKVCYEASVGLGSSEAVGDCRGSSSCEFKVNGEDQRIFFGLAPVLKEHFVYHCHSTTKMQFPFADFLSEFISFESCEPKIGDNKMIKLFVDIDPECSIKVKNARIYVPKVTLTESPPKRTSKDSSEASFPIWGYIIIIVGIIVLIVILIICFIAYHLYKTPKPSKHIPPNIDEIKPKPTVSNAKVAIVETPTNQNLKLAKVEPKMNNEMSKHKSKKNQKKDKKKKTKIQVPTTTEDIPTFSQQESVASIPSKQLPPPNPAACLPEVKRIIPRSMKSAKNDSLGETLKKDKSVMMESESVKF